MDHTATNDSEGNVSLEAASRRRRMHRRYAKRRLTRIGFVAFAVFASAHLLTPDRDPQATSSRTDVRTVSAGRSPAKPLASSSSLLLAPSWRPAGEVLKRKANPGMVLP